MTKELQDRQIKREESFASIGKKYGLSSEQVKQICERLKELESLGQMLTFADSLSAESKNGLAYCFFTIDIIYHPEKIVKDGVNRLKNSGYFNQKSLEEIAELLYEFGYIKYPYDWLKS